MASRLTIAVPCYRPQLELLASTVDRALAAATPECTLALFPNGPEAIEVVSQLALPSSVDVNPSREPLELVPNWNRCLDHATTELVHVLHAGDLVAGAFYRAILAAADAFPCAALYATAAGEGEPDDRVEPAGPRLLVGDDAARFLLVDDRQACGNVVIRRDVVRRHGPFLAPYSHCTDEEAYLRWAADGGIGFDPAVLYLEEARARQTSAAAWRREDFVPVYMAARTTGAEAYGDDVRRLAVRSSVRRATSIAVSLAAGGDRAGAHRILEAVRPYERSAAGRLRLVAARVVCSLEPLVSLAERRRAFLKRRTAGATS